MDSFEFSKIAGGVLCALLAIVLPREIASLMSEGHGEHAEKAGYTLPVAEAPAADAHGAPAAKLAATEAAPAAAGAPAAPGSGNIFDTVKPLLAAAKPEGGAGTFKICQACHNGEKGAGNKVGPALWGVVGRKTGSVDGFGYSEAMKGKGGEWTYDRLAAFLNNPKGYVPGTKMVYNGVKDPAQLADLLAYLGTLSDAPVPLPK